MAFTLATLVGTAALLAACSSTGGGTVASGSSTPVPPGSSTAIRVFLKDSVSADARRQLEASIAGMPEVESFKYVSKSEALNTLLAQTGSGATSTLATMSPNPLPASYLLTLNDRGKAVTVARRFFESPLVDHGYPGTERGVLLGAYIPAPAP